MERVLPRARQLPSWSERWQSGDERLRRIEEGLKQAGYGIVSGGAFDRWDLEVRRGVMSGVRLRTAIEEHGEGRQMVRFRIWPAWSRVWIACTLGLAVLAIAAIFARHPIIATILLVGAAATAAWALERAAAAMGAVVRVLGTPTDRLEPAEKERQA
jgi:hypothetical protein